MSTKAELRQAAMWRTLEGEAHEVLKDYSAEERRKLAKKGHAMPDGSYPIANCKDWDNARRAVGRSPASRRPAIRAHISKRGKALGCK